MPSRITKSALGIGSATLAFVGIAWCCNVALAVVKPSTRSDEPEPPPSASAQPATPSGPMSLSLLDQLVTGIDKGAQRDAGVWSLELEGIPLKVITDEHADRMRIVCPVVRTSEMSEVQYLRVMEANFHTALDARYATSHGILFSAFIHRLSTLDPSDFVSGVQQVAHLAAGFGTTYSSGVMRFGQ